jgi:hypothetical protein
VVVVIVLDRLIIWLVGAGSAAVESGFGPQAHLPATAIAWLLSIAAGLGIVVGSVFLMPAVIAFVGSFFADQIAEEVERVHYPGDPSGAALPLWLAIPEDGAARGRGLYLRGAVPVVRRFWRRDFFSCNGLAARTRIFQARRHALSIAG